MNGYGAELIIDLKDIPYNCVIYGKGDIYNLPTLMTPTMQFLSMNVPKISDFNSISNVTENDIVYHVQDYSLYIFKNGVWSKCQFHH